MNKTSKEVCEIYVIMTMEKLEKGDIECSIGCSTIPGFYTKKDYAFYTVINNVCDIWETCYDYALIERVAEGLYNPALSDSRWWFKYNRTTGKYELIDEPVFCKHLVGFTIA